jgi:hypothetical protein
VFAAVSVAAWTDERALLVALVVCAFHLANDRRGPSLAVVAALSAYAAVRLWLTVAYDLHVDTAAVGWDVLSSNARFVPVAALLALEGAWLVIGIGIREVWRARRVYAATLAALVLVSGVGAVLVYDVTRSMAYLLPAFLVVAVEGVRLFPRRARLLWGCAAVTAVIPTIWIAGYDYWATLWPLPLKVIGHQ